MEQRLLVPNGIQFETGEYAHPPASVEEIAAWARRQPQREDLEGLKQWREGRERRLRNKRADPGDLSQAGWGLLFAKGDPRTDEILSALEELRTLRRQQVGEQKPHYYRELTGDKGYRPGDTKDSYLRRFGVGVGAVEPDKMPYYILIVGDPETIPWDFQYELDIQYAVGRIWFETIAEYERYAHNLVAAEASTEKKSRTAAFFAVQHEGDTATELSLKDLATPLADLADAEPGWEVVRAFGEQAKKARLRSLLDGEDRPDLLFTASHGVVLGRDSRVLETYQGSILCHEYPGPKKWKGGNLMTHFLCADDLELRTPRPGGMISFHFACYSAGSPREHDFRYKADAPAEVAPRPFIARLPRRLLADGGALAVVGHVETAFQCSIEWGEAGRQIQAFEDALQAILQGRPVGEAMEVFGERFAELSAPLSRELQRLHNGGPEDPQYLAELWMASNDSRNYVVLGDPAVRLGGAKGAS